MDIYYGVTAPMVKAKRPSATIVAAPITPSRRRPVFLSWESGIKVSGISHRTGSRLTACWKDVIQHAAAAS